MKKDPNVSANMVAILRNGGEFWNVLKKILENEKKDINRDVFNKEDLGLSDKAVDDLIRWHKFLEYVINLPELCIQSLEEQPEKGGLQDNDPYDHLPLRDVRETIKHNGQG